MNDGNRKLREYLAAPEHVQDQFDRRVREAIERQREQDEWLAEELGDELGHVPAEPLDVKWDASWSKRATRPRPKPGDPEPYDRATDPLLQLDVRSVWSDLTGLDLRGEASRCPLPDHDDRFPSCGVKERFWRCNRCDKGGSLIDLGAAIYGIEPRGRGFHDIRQRLLADLGMDEARAA